MAEMGSTACMEVVAFVSHLPVFKLFPKLDNNGQGLQPCENGTENFSEFRIKQLYNGDHITDFQPFQIGFWLNPDSFIDRQRKCVL